MALAWLSQVRHPDRARNRAQVLEEPLPVGDIPDAPGILEGQSGDAEVLQLSPIVQGGDDAVAGPGQGAGALQDALQNVVQVEALVDAETGVAEAGKPLAQRGYLPVADVGFAQLAPPCRPAGPVPGHRSEPVLGAGIHPFAAIIPLSA